MLLGLSVRPPKSCSVVKEGPLTEPSEDRRNFAMPNVDFHRPPPVAEKQHETVHLDVVYLVLPMMVCRSCQGEDFPTADAAEVFAERLCYVTDGLTRETERLSSSPTFGPGLLAVSGYSHVRDAFSHPEQCGRVLSLLKVRVSIRAKLYLQLSSRSGMNIPSNLSSKVIVPSVSHITRPTKLPTDLPFTVMTSEWGLL